jgi:hypothetical protein
MGQRTVAAPCGDGGRGAREGGRSTSLRQLGANPGGFQVELPPAPRPPPGLGTAKRRSGRPSISAGWPPERAPQPVVNPPSCLLTGRECHSRLAGRARVALLAAPAPPALCCCGAWLATWGDQSHGRQGGLAPSPGPRLEALAGPGLAVRSHLPSSRSLTAPHGGARPLSMAPGSGPSSHLLPCSVTDPCDSGFQPATSYLEAPEQPREAAKNGQKQRELGESGQRVERGAIVLQKAFINVSETAKASGERARANNQPTAVDRSAPELQELAAAGEGCSAVRGNRLAAAGARQQRAVRGRGGTARARGAARAAGRRRRRATRGGQNANLPRFGEVCGRAGC